MICNICRFDAGGDRQKLADHVAKVHKRVSTVAKRAEPILSGNGLSPSGVIPRVVEEVKKVVKRAPRRAAKPKAE